MVSVFVKISFKNISWSKYPNTFHKFVLKRLQFHLDIHILKHGIFYIYSFLIKRRYKLRAPPIL